jgi:hypothetical protein
VQFDLELQGLGILVAVSLVFGVIAQLALGRGTTRWMWLIGAVAWFVGGLLASEVVWGTATEEELQPIIGRLAFDESLLGGLVVGVPVVLVTWYVARRRHRLHQPAAA